MHVVLWIISVIITQTVQYQSNADSSTTALFSSIETISTSTVEDVTISTVDDSLETDNYTDSEDDVSSSTAGNYESHPTIQEQSTIINSENVTDSGYTQPMAFFQNLIMKIIKSPANSVQSSTDSSTALFSSTVENVPINDENAKSTVDDSLETDNYADSVDVSSSTMDNYESSSTIQMPSTNINEGVTDSGCTENITITEIIPSDFKVTLKWKEPPAECKNLNYSIYINDQETATTTELNITIDKLYACMDYNVSIKAFYDDTNSRLSDVQTFTTNIPSNFSKYTVGNAQVNGVNGERNFEIAWTSPVDEVLKCVQKYYVHWEDDKEDFDIKGTQLLQADARSFKIQSVACVMFRVSVTPEADFGNQNVNGSSLTRSYTEKFVTDPPDLIESIIDTNNATFTWSINQSNNKCTLKTMNISCSVTDTNSQWTIPDSSAEVPLDNIDVSDFNVTLKNLSPFTNYSCEAIVINSKGPSEAYSFEFATLETVTSEPRDLQIMNIQSNSFEIKWQEPENITSIIQSYKVEIFNNGPNYTHPETCQFDSNNITVNITNSKLELSYVYKNALPFFEYRVSVSTVAKAGESSRAMTQTITKSSKPNPITNLTIKINYSQNEEFDATVQIDFEAPCYLNGPFENFQISYNATRKDNESNTQTNTDEPNLNFSVLPERKYEGTVEVITSDSRSEAVKFQFETQSGVPLLVSDIMAPKAQDERSAIFQMDKTVFSDDNGDVIAFALFITKRKFEQTSNYGFWNGTWPEAPPNTIQLTPNFWNQMNTNNSLRFTIGAEESCSHSEYCNKYLEDDTEYGFLVRALSTYGYKDSRFLYFKTEPMDSRLDVILGSIFGVLILLVFIGLYVYYYFWRRKRLNIETFDEEKKPSLSPAALSKESFKIHFESIIQDRDILKEQYNELNLNSKTLPYETSFALLPENRRKNRYTNILPYDATRVTLKIDEDDEIGSDYINASYITGFSGKVEYIATQGPLQSTVRDFWKMIIQENVTLIVMVSQFIEQNKEKCHQYFPNNHETMTFGDDLEVKCYTELHFGTYCIRSLQVQKGLEQHDVCHMQFLEWPDFGIPSSSDIMIQFCIAIRERILREGGLIVVHCSAGVGRTGTLIAIDVLFQTIDDHRDINVYKTVLDLRKQRTNMVQTENQYFYIHKCVSDYIDTAYHRNDKYYSNFDQNWWYATGRFTHELIVE